MSQFQINGFDEHFKGIPIIGGFVISTLHYFSILVVYSATGSLGPIKYAGGNTECVLFKHSMLIFALWAWCAAPHDSLPKVASCMLGLVSLFDSDFDGDYLIWLQYPMRQIGWITIPVINQAFQPSWLAKLALIRSHCRDAGQKRQNNIKDFKAPLCRSLLRLDWSVIDCRWLNFSTCWILLALWHVFWSVYR